MRSDFDRFTLATTSSRPKLAFDEENKPHRDKSFTLSTASSQPMIHTLRLLLFFSRFDLGHRLRQGRSNLIFWTDR